ncbi:hypothetical protein [Lactobacillus sp. M0396]|uniref:hypothetical protein n=1 Tax=Lactobacillus sp. M0396 TaxID=2751030 RepID=UPI0018DBC62B|nr:hypothetical protein [Lactobacillus sp. M0396]MBI0034025.1 hypothetical protein [Lactobacillus sp. M0396]
MAEKISVVASELPVLSDPAGYRLLKEIAADGHYRQVAWLKDRERYVPLYGTSQIKDVADNPDENIEILAVKGEGDD